MSDKDTFTDEDLKRLKHWTTTKGVIGVTTISVEKLDSLLSRLEATQDYVEGLEGDTNGAALESLRNAYRTSRGLA